jgi:hypothetical protein
MMKTEVDNQNIPLEVEYYSVMSCVSIMCSSVVSVSCMLGVSDSE